VPSAADTRAMTTTYILTAALVLVVVRQLHGRKLAGPSLYVPLAIVAYVTAEYLRGIPTTGNDLRLAVVGAATGAALGCLCGLHTLVYTDRGVPYARATGFAAALWVAGVGARLAFSLYAQHGGGSAIAHFSVTHSLTMQAWIAALVLMALAEVVSRTAVLVFRSRSAIMA
jgi:hypothetical protein